MKRNVNRRSFVLGGSAGFALGGLAPFAAAQVVTSGAIHKDVLDFWVNRVGVPPEVIMGGPARSRGPSSTVLNVRKQAIDYGSEPLFLYVDELDNTLIPAQELPKERLLPYGDTMVDMSVGRLRLNSSDIQTFSNFTTSGIYFEIGQQPTAKTPNLASLGWSLFGALHPQLFSKLGGGQKAAPQAPPPPAGGLMQSIALPNGSGQAMFNCFLKDQKKSAFGSFLSAFTQLGAQALSSFVPMLALPGIASPAMNFVRGLVARLQGSDQRWLFQQTPMNLACTTETAVRQGSLRLRTGNYVVLPKSQAGLLKSNLNNLKVLDGFLVPKQATMYDVFDAAPQTLSGVSYLTANVNVQRAQLNTCVVAGGMAR